MVHTRAQGKSRRVSMGRHGVVDARAGAPTRRPAEDSPSANGPTISEMAEQYMTDHVAVRCKPTAERGCRHILDKFLLSRFGALRLSEVTPDHVAVLQLPAARQTGHVEPGGLAALPTVLHERKVGRGAGRGQSLQLHREISDARAVPLSSTAIQVLTTLPRRPDNPWVFPGRVRGTRLHVLIHSLASRALALGENLPMIGSLRWSRAGADDRALRPPCAKLGEGRCRENSGQSGGRHGHPAGRFRRPLIYGHVIDRHELSPSLAGSTGGRRMLDGRMPALTADGRQRGYSRFIRLGSSSPVG